MAHDLTCKVLDHPGRMCSDITPDDRINLLPQPHTPIDVCRHGRSIIQVCDQCVALSDAPQPHPSGSDTEDEMTTIPQLCDNCKHRLSALGVCGNTLCPKSANYVYGSNLYVPPDTINHPPHYTQHPSGVECITITEHYNFNVGNAIKYLWRAGLKDGADADSDLHKAAWYVQREIERPLQPTAAVVYCGLCNVSLTSPFCRNQACPQSPLYDGQSNAL